MLVFLQLFLAVSSPFRLASLNFLRVHSPFQAVCSLLKLSNPFRVVCSRRFLKFPVAFESLCWFLNWFLICCHPCFLCSQTLSTCLSALLLHLEFYSTFRVACSYFSNALIHVAQLSPLSLILLSFTTRTGDASPNLVSPVHFERCVPVEFLKLFFPFQLNRAFCCKAPLIHLVTYIAALPSR